MEEAKKNPVQRYIVILFIALAGGFITKLPYIMTSYYTVLEKATGATRTQLGLLQTIYGIINFIVYLPGGYLADRVSAKKLVVIGALGTGIFGIWYALLPDYIWLCVIHMGFAITSVFIFWAAMVKAVNNLGANEEQGKMFGFLEGSRYLIGTAAMYGSVFVFNRFIDETAGFRGVLTYYSVGVMTAGILVALFLKEPKKTDPETQKTEIISFALFKAVLKYPHIWVCGLIVFFNYIPISLSWYLNAYFVDTFKIDTSRAAFWSISASAFSSILGAYGGGWVADKIGSRVKFMAFAFAGMIACIVGMLLVPGVERFLYVFFAIAVLFYLSAYCIKSLYFSTLGDVKMPPHLAGASSGVISLVGYAPDMFIYLVAGFVMDKMGNTFGYRFNFIFMLVSSGIGLICCAVLLNMIKKAGAFEEK
jgi:MFS family permease